MLSRLEEAERGDRELPDHVLKDYVRALAEFIERADEQKKQAEHDRASAFVLLDELKNLPAERAAQLLADEVARLGGLHDVHASSLVDLVGEERAVELLDARSVHG
jgi:hypothetical protein